MYFCRTLRKKVIFWACWKNCNTSETIAKRPLCHLEIHSLYPHIFWPGKFWWCNVQAPIAVVCDLWHLADSFYGSAICSTTRKRSSLWKSTWLYSQIRFWSPRLSACSNPQWFHFFEFLEASQYKTTFFVTIPYLLSLLLDLSQTCSSDNIVSLQHSLAVANQLIVNSKMFPLPMSSNERGCHPSLSIRHCILVLYL